MQRIAEVSNKNEIETNEAVDITFNISSPKKILSYTLEFGDSEKENNFIPKFY